MAVITRKEGKTMKNYRIYLDEVDTDFVYNAENKEDAIEQYKEFCFEDYFNKFGEYPSEEDWTNGIEITAVEE